MSFEDRLMGRGDQEEVDGPDPGTAWHSKRLFDKLRDLPDLSEAEVEEHMYKPEADLRDRSREAESSAESPEGAI